MITRTKFKTNARTVNLLGKDNVLDFKSAVIELIKNSYDAYSEGVYICVDTNKMVIADNGIGMSYEEIVDVFFTLGTDSKLFDKERTIQMGREINGSMGIGRLSMGRISKKATIITSDGQSAFRFRFDWEDFDSGQDLADLSFEIEEVGLQKFEKIFSAFEEVENKVTGTIIIMEDLNDYWYSNEDKSILAANQNNNYDVLKKSLNGVLNPMKYTNDFKIVLNYFGEVEQLTNETKLINSSAEMSIEYDSNNKELTLRGFFHEFDVNAFPDDFVEEYSDVVKGYLYNDKEKNLKFQFHHRINLINLDGEIMDIKEVEGMKRKNTVKEILDIGNFSGKLYFVRRPGGTKIPFVKNIITRAESDKIERGISLFRDSFRVRPYGEEGTIAFDWLGIEAKRSQNPAAVSRKDYIMQANQLVGHINITKESNDNFIDQSNREGIRSTKEFDEFKKILLFSVIEFSKIRSKMHIKYEEFVRSKSNYEYHSKIGETKVKSIKSKLSNHKGDLISLYNDSSFIELVTKETIYELFSLNVATDEVNTFLTNENDLLRSLATQGILMSTFAHQVKNDRKFIENEPEVLREMAHEYDRMFNTDIGSLSNDVNLIYYSDLVEKVNSNILGFIVASIKKQSKNRNRLISLTKYFKATISWWSDIISDRFNNYVFTINSVNVNDYPDELNEYNVYANEAQLDSIFLNLLSNSLSNFNEFEIKERRIDLELEIGNNDLVKILYSDNGTGLSHTVGLDKNVIFKPFESYSHKEEATGMGLWILDSAVKSLNGEKELICEVGQQGFEILITLNGEELGLE
ncbi:ATP-binding protein [Erysipelothrix enhydrae]|uniref:ATP-binding protein n=1 Tax=Erysipelothrix enhydrae TaxID=2890314 RepID=UPI002B2411AB|nr:ATP-binding protein [Erysipelothrix sp. 4322-04]WRB87234.1 ATP-binding protein [Erysipelothrix sp. 4322-04]